MPPFFMLKEAMEAPTGYTTTESGIYVPTMMASAQSDLKHPTAWLQDWALGVRSLAGVPVTPQTSLGLSTYYACIRAIAEDCAKLPLQVCEYLPRGRRKAFEHWAWPILHDRFNADMTAMAAREVMTHWALGWGNGYGIILRDRSMTLQDGQPVGIYPIHPSRVEITRDRETNRLLYEIRRGATLRDNNEVPMVIDMADMVHLKGPSPDGLIGYTVAHIAAESLGLSLAAQTYGAGFFANSARPSGILTYPGKLNDAARKNIRDSWEATYGGASNAGKVALLEEDLKFSALSLPPEVAQFLETRNFQVREVCRWFRMPPHKVADLSDAKWANVESENISYVVDTLTPWFVRWEQELQTKLLVDEPEYYPKHNVNGLLRGDMQARAEYYRTLIANGIYSPNDVLEFEDMNPYEGGDEHFMQVNMAPVSSIVSGAARQQKAPREPMDVDDNDQASYHQNGVRTHAPR